MEKLFTCTQDGVVEILSGHEARSADVKAGDVFIAKAESKLGYEGTLRTKGTWSHRSGLSGKKTDQTPIRGLGEQPPQTPADQLAYDISNTIKKHFPDSYVSSKFTTGFGATITVRFAESPKDKWINGYVENDRAHTLFLIFGANKDGTLPDKLELQSAITGLHVPATDPGLHSERLKGSKMSNKTGTKEQLLKHIDRYFANLETLTLEHPLKK
jgi:hypothetical protein